VPRLPYLKSLGVGALWLSPVLKNCPYRETYHGYGIQDFLAIEPRLAGGAGQEEGSCVTWCGPPMTSASM
jgi:glycosidase